MNDALTLFVVEVRRCLSRRLVWFLLAIAVLAIVLTSVLVFVNVSGGDDGAVQRELLVQDCIGDRTDDVQRAALCRQSVPPPDDEQFRLTDAWSEGDGFLLATVFFLVVGALIGGASMTGAEWRGGTITTLLTWEPRRVRLAVAKLAAVAVCAFVLAFALQVLFVVGLVPAVLVHGTTEGADGAWFRDLLGGLLRTELLVAMVAVVGASLAMIGRNSAAALGASLGYLLVGETLFPAWKFGLSRWLIIRNAQVFLRGDVSQDSSFATLSFPTATLALIAYTIAIAALAVALFRARDVAAS